MKSRFITDPQDPSDSFLDTAGNDFFTNYQPPIGGGNPPASAPALVAPTPALTSEAVQSEGAQSGPTSVVAVTSGSGITINLLFDAAAMAEIDRILAAAIKSPVGPEFMAPPEKVAA